jgi:hypothetical protein
LTPNLPSLTPNLIFERTEFERKKRRMPAISKEKNSKEKKRILKECLTTYPGNS